MKKYGATDNPSELVEIKTSEDVKQAAALLADAFKDDAHILWFFGSKENYAKHSKAIFESWVWYGVYYGHVYKSGDFDCVAMIKEPGHFGFSVWGMIWSGMIFQSLWRLGYQGYTRMSEYDANATPNAQQLPSTQNFWYLWQIGTSSQKQGQGLGKILADKLEDKILELSHGKPATVYLEAVSVGSERFFKRRGYQRKGSYELGYTKSGDGPPVICMEKTLMPK